MGILPVFRIEDLELWKRECPGCELAEAEDYRICDRRFSTNDIEITEILHQLPRRRGW